MVDILAIGSHPDDLEFGCGGILAKMASLGQSIVMVSLTEGEKGTNGTREIRRKEAEAAAALIKATCLFLDFSDCEVIDSYEGRLKITQVIREYQPKLVLAPDMREDQNHPDHSATGRMARFATRYARFSKILPELPVHTANGILHYPSIAKDDVDFLFDITDHVEIWKKMMQAHNSQGKTMNYQDRCLKIAGRYGALIGKEYAQGLIKCNPIVIDDLMTLSRGGVEI